MIAIEQDKDGVRLEFIGGENDQNALVEFHDRIFADARLFALECVRILVEQYGAHRQGISFEHFYYTAAGQQIGFHRSSFDIEKPTGRLLICLWALETKTEFLRR